MSHKDSEMNEIEAALAAWTPRSPQIDRDRLMFAAGSASHSPAILAGRSLARFLWPVATSFSTAAAIAMAFLLAQDRAGRGPAAEGGVAAQPIAVAAPPVLPPQRSGLSVGSTPLWRETAPLDGTYLALRNQMLNTPVDQWPIPVSLNTDVRRGASAIEDDAALKPSTSRNLLRELLPPEPPVQRGAEPVRRGSPDPAATPAAHITEPHEAIT
ncbi:MAG: hypothetical protein WD851_20080 [Pirellulales bacterium]